MALLWQTHIPVKQRLYALVHAENKNVICFFSLYSSCVHFPKLHVNNSQDRGGHFYLLWARGAEWEISALPDC